MTEQEIAKRIYTTWMQDERWARLDLAEASKHTPLGYFWAEIAAKAVVKAIKDDSKVP